MDERYEVFATHGKGVFSTVLRARDQQCGSGPSEVAIKIIRANETMSKAAQTEKVIGSYSHDRVLSCLLIRDWAEGFACCCL